MMNSSKVSTHGWKSTLPITRVLSRNREPSWLKTFKPLIWNKDPNLLVSVPRNATPSTMRKSLNRILVHSSWVELFSRNLLREPLLTLSKPIRRKSMREVLWLIRTEGKVSSGLNWWVWMRWCWSRTKNTWINWNRVDLKLHRRKSSKLRWSLKNRVKVVEQSLELFRSSSILFRKSKRVLPHANIEYRVGKMRRKEREDSKWNNWWSNSIMRRLRMIQLKRGSGVIN